MNVKYGILHQANMDDIKKRLIFFLEKKQSEILT